MSKLRNYLVKQGVPGAEDNSLLSSVELLVDSIEAEQFKDASEHEAKVWRNFILCGGPIVSVKDKYEEWNGKTKLSADDAGQFCWRLTYELKLAEDQNQCYKQALEGIDELISSNSIGYVDLIIGANHIIAEALKESEQDD